MNFPLDSTTKRYIVIGLLVMSSMIVAVFCYILAIGSPIPSELQALVASVISLWFGIAIDTKEVFNNGE